MREKEGGLTRSKDSYNMGTSALDTNIIIIKEYLGDITGVSL